MGLLNSGSCLQMRKGNFGSNEYRNHPKGSVCRAFSSMSPAISVNGI